MTFWYYDSHRKKWRKREPTRFKERIVGPFCFINRPPHSAPFSKSRRGKQRRDVRKFIKEQDHVELNWTSDGASV